MKGLLATSALVPLGLMVVVPDPARAACVLTGTGTVTQMDSGDSVLCLGPNNNTIRSINNGASNIVITIGDGTTPTSVVQAADTVILLDEAADLLLTVTNQAAIIAQSGSFGVLLSGGDNDNATISVTAGGTISADTSNAAIRLSGGAVNTIDGFHLFMNGTLTGGVGFSSLNMAGGVVQIGSGGTINAGTGILLDGSHNNSIVLGAGGLIHHTATIGSGISLTASDNNTITIGGTINGNAIGASGISTLGGATGNQITILSTGSVQENGTGSDGISLGDGGNIVDNSGTIFVSAAGIRGAGGADTVINSGSITGGVGGAIDLAGGADSLTLKTGSSISGYIDLGAGTDTLTLQGTGTLSSNVMGAETVIVNGSLWTMAGNLTGSGTIDIQAGKFVLNGSASAYDVTVQNGGIFGGIGPSQSLTANSGGIVAPGNSIGTTQVGNATFNAGSIYQVEVAPNGTSDLIAATGTATINGGTVQIIPLGTAFLANTQYTILTAAGGVTGTFDLLTLSFPLLTGLLTYDPNNVYFMLQQTAGFSSLALTPNQFAAGNALDQAALAGVATGPLLTAMNTLAVNNAAGVQSGLDDLAGQILADSRRLTVDQAAGFHRFIWGAGIQSSGEAVRVAASPAPMTSSYAAGPQDPIGGHVKAPAAPSRNVWFGTYGSWDRAAGTSTTFGTNTSVGGAALGVDIWRTATLVIGVAAGASAGQLKSTGRPDSVDANAGHGAIYARNDLGDFSFNTAVSYAFAALDTSRSISFLGQTATGSTNAHTFGASFGVSTIVDLAGVKIEPFANLDWFSSRHSGFTETGAPGVNQLVNGGSHDLLQGTAGARLKHRMTTGDGRAFDIGATLAVRHDFDGSAAGMTTAFEGAPGIPFTINGVEHGRTAAILGGQIGFNVTRTTSLSAGYEAELASDRSRHAVQGAIRTRF